MAAQASHAEASIGHLALSSRPTALCSTTSPTPCRVPRLWRPFNSTNSSMRNNTKELLLKEPTKKNKGAAIVCGLGDYIGGDLLGFDLGKWENDVEKHGALALYAPAEGGYEGRYATLLSSKGYRFMDLSARGLGDVEAYLSKIHTVRPPHLGKQKIVTWYFPPEIDYRLSLLPEDCKGLVLWVIEAKVLSKSELQYLAILPTIQPKVKVIAECGTWRKVRWKPLREIAGLDPMT